MNKFVRKEQRTAQQHPVLWPTVFIVIGAILLGAGLLYLAIQSSKPADQNKSQPQDKKQPIEQLENSEENQFQNTENSL